MSIVRRSRRNDINWLADRRGVFKSWGYPSVGLGFQHCDSRAEVTMKIVVRVELIPDWGEVHSVEVGRIDRQRT